MISSLLHPYEGVIAADTGHITVHEAGAIECGDHKVLALPHADGKLTARAIESCLRTYHEDANRDHMVRSGMVYLSHPTEYGTLYTMDELEVISAICRASPAPCPPRELLSALIRTSSVHCIAYSMTHDVNAHRDGGRQHPPTHPFLTQFPIFQDI